MQDQIHDMIGVPAVCEQCAEECSELAKAALKLARIIRNENPTPVSLEKAVQDLQEELADVEVCITALRQVPLIHEKRDIINARRFNKTRRWRKRVYLHKQGEALTQND